MSSAELTAGQKAARTRAENAKRRRNGARGVLGGRTIQKNTWAPGKVAFLEGRLGAVKPGACVVCGDARPKVLQDHHYKRFSRETCVLCANCHDLVRRGTIEDLKAVVRQ